MLGIAGVVLIATGQFLRVGSLEGASLIWSLGILMFILGFLPYILQRGYRDLTPLRKLERVLGVVGALFMVSGILFKFMHYPSAAIQMIFAIILFVFGYVPLQLFLSWREAETRLQKVYSVVRFIAFFLVLLGFCLKTMHWPGAGVALALGMFIIPIYLMFYFILRMKGQGRIPFLTGDLLLAILAYFIWIFVTANTISRSAVEGYRLMEDQYLQMIAGIESSNSLIYASINSEESETDPSLKATIGELRQLGQEYMQTSDSIKEGFYRMILGAYYKQGSNHLRIQEGTLANDHPVEEYFFERENAPRIKQAVNRYRDGAEMIARKHHIKSSAIGLGLETADIDYGNGYTQTWISYIFEDVPVGSVIVNLSLLMQMVLITESNLLNALVSRMDLSEEAVLLQELASRESERAIRLKENEITRVRQQQELQEVLLEQSLMETRQNKMMAIFGFGGVALVLVLFSISTRAYMRQQKDNRTLQEQSQEITEKNEELSHQNEEIAAQRDEIEAQRNLVSDQKALIERAHEELSSSIDYAMRLQDSILSLPDLMEEHFHDHFILFRPKQKVSGDFYWWGEAEGHMIITATDCTGHGVPGAFMSMMGISLLREIVVKEKITDPGKILDQLREEVIRSLYQRGASHEQKDGMDLSLVSIDIRTLECGYAGANNPLYHIRDGELTVYRPQMMPISHYQKMDPFRTREIPLKEGDQLYLFSDGYADQFGGEQRKKFKYGAFRQLLLDHSGLPMAEQLEVLEKTITDWQGSQEQIDDMVVIGVQI